MIYLVLQRAFHKSIVSKSDPSSSDLDRPDHLNETKDDDVDIQLDKIDGRTARQPNPQLYEQSQRSICLINSFL